jgi:glycosyltransferase involved in cell wall biosynthesis
MQAVRTLRPLLLVDTIEIGGAGKVALESIRGLTAAGARVTVANFRYPGRPSRFDGAAHAAGADVIPLLQHSRTDWSCVRALQDIARERGVNLIESHSFKAHVLGWRLRGPLGVPWLAYAHGWTAETLRVRLYNALERQLLRSPDHVCVVAQPIAAAIRGAGRCEPLSVVPNGLDPTRAIEDGERAAVRRAYGLRDDEIVAAVVGRLSHEKGIDVLLEAFAIAIPAEPRLRLHVAGDGPERARAEATIARLNLGERVSLLGQVRDVRKVYAAADLLVVPSRTEGLPNVVLEALDAGLPVLATQVGAIPELVSDGVTGWLVPPGDVGALARGLARAAASPELRAMGLLGRERILPSFSAQARLQRLFQIYAGLLEARTPPPPLQGGEVRP